MTRLSQMIREPSTWRGLGLALSLAGVAAGPGIAEAIGAAAIAGISLWEIIRKELGR